MKISLTDPGLQTTCKGNSIPAKDYMEFEQKTKDRCFLLLYLLCFGDKEQKAAVYSLKLKSER